MNSTPNKLYITQKDIASMLDTIVSKMKLDNYEPDAIVGVNRGGLQIAVMLSHYFDVPCIPIASSVIDHESWDTGIPAGKYLVIDDDCGEGFTLAGIKANCDAEENIDVKYAVLYYNTGANFQPDYWAEINTTINSKTEGSTDPYIVYPWEIWHMDQIRRKDDNESR